MKQYLSVTPEERVIGLGSSIVYGNRAEWCNATWRPLEMSLMRSRQFFYYDKEETGRGRTLRIYCYKKGNGVSDTGGIG